MPQIQCATLDGPREQVDQPYGFPGKRELLSRLTEVYHRHLLASESIQAYLNARGLTSAVWETFKLGYCDGQLAEKLLKQPELRQALQEIGVVMNNGQERFRDCVVVPLTHPDKGVVGFCGRHIFRNRNADVYMPGRHGVLDWQSLRDSRTAVLTDDVWSAFKLWQAGITSVSCTFGGADLSKDLAELLQRYQLWDVTLCLPGDTTRIAQRLEQMDIRVAYARFPELLRLGARRKPR